MFYEAVAVGFMATAALLARKQARAQSAIFFTLAASSAAAANTASADETGDRRSGDFAWGRGAAGQGRKGNTKRER